MLKRITLKVLFIILLAGSSLLSPAGATENIDSPYINFCVKQPFFACGLINSQGNWQTPPFYQTPLIYRDGIYISKRASLDSPTYLLDHEGKPISRNIADSITSLNNGLFSLHNRAISRFARLIYRDGHMASQQKFTTIKPFNDELAAALPAKNESPENLWGYIDQKGEWVIKPQFNKASDFHSGRAYVEIDRQPAWINPKGEIISLISLQQHIHYLNDNIWLAKADDEHPDSLIDQYGNIIFSAQQIIRIGHHRVKFFNHGQYGLYHLQTRTTSIIPATFWKNMTQFNGDMVWIKQQDGDNSQLTLLDKNGIAILKTDYDFAYEFHENRAWVGRKTPNGGEIWGMIDQKGQVIIPFIYIKVMPAKQHNEPIKFGYHFAQMLTEDGMKRIDLFGSNGNIIVSSIHYSHWQGEACAPDFTITYNSIGEKIWPQNIMGNCLFNRLQENIPIDYQKDYLAARRSESLIFKKLENERDSTQLAPIFNHPAWVHGPAKIYLDTIAEVNLPAGYLYLPQKSVIELYENQNWSIERYATTECGLIMPEDRLWIACLKMDTNRRVTDGTLSWITTTARLKTLFSPQTIWSSPPVWEQKQQLLRWGFKFENTQILYYIKLGGTADITLTTQINNDLQVLVESDLSTLIDSIYLNQPRDDEQDLMAEDHIDNITLAQLINEIPQQNEEVHLAIKPYERFNIENEEELDKFRYIIIVFSMILTAITSVLIYLMFFGASRNNQYNNHY